MNDKEKKEITVQDKKEVQTKSEPTIPGKVYLPNTDIVETDKELLVYMDMPGVSKEKIRVKIEKNVLAIDGEIDSSPYSNLKPLYTEYNIGHFSRSFELSNEIDQNGINATMTDGVLLLTLPKAPDKQPKMISVN
ncbi:Hsp20/alpha crystallin family protein [bacterium]|nr:Hsp20/alpha crystallin family protein [bacterium]